ncbi:rhodanese-like domain-containing protein [Mycoplasma sp. HU2014]|uniref:rhodanese-like domain-containing protein n=1 Tax=Mycoplasma sp. HU2014 TaxID=1664275 RepID=UPI00067E444D|nr:rhodanese-like domain-containing protein [Mycoplasma sp. HU2014]
MDKISISKEEFFQLLDQGWKVIDVRDDYEYKNFKRFEPSENISYLEVLNNPQFRWPNINEKLIMVCNHGNRSSLTARFLQKMGYENVYVLDRGIYSLE